MLELTCRPLRSAPETVVLRGFGLFCAGYTGRDQAAVKRHVDELARDLGVPAPATVPTCYPMAERLAIVEPGEIEVYGDRTSGEAEPVLYVLGGRVRYLGVGSDHTDRAVERHGIAEAKNLCPKILSAACWAVEEVLDRWDALELRSWSDGEPYQEARLAEMLPPERLLACVPEERRGVSAVIMGGTVPTLSGEFRFGRRFECSLRDPETARELRISYDIRALQPIS